MTENNNFYKINGYVTLEKVDSELPENKDQVTFDTNLKISNHSRNKLHVRDVFLLSSLTHLRP